MHTVFIVLDIAWAMETWFKIPSKLILWVFYQLWGLLNFINVVEVSTTYSSHSISFSLSSPGLNKLTPAIEPIDTFFHGPNCTDARTDRQTLLAAQPTKTGRKATLYTNSLGRSVDLGDWLNRLGQPADYTRRSWREEVSSFRERRSCRFFPSSSFPGRVGLENCATCTKHQ